MDPNLFHTLPGGIEVKIVDIIMILFNVAIIFVAVAAYIIYRVYKRIKSKNARKSLQIGQLMHLADISGDKLYQWKQTNRMVQPKKKAFLKTSKPKPTVNNEEIVCKSCGLVIKTTTNSFT